MNVQERVKVGIAVLDAYGPRHWRRKLTAAIKADRFDLRNPSHCALGEVYGDYSKGLDILNLHGHFQVYGFDCGSVGDDDYVGYDALTAEWIRQYQEGAKLAAEAHRCPTKPAITKRKR